MRFLVLDSWRGICAVLVALHHLRLANHYESLAFYKGSFLLVDFFFVLSGFVLMQAYGGQLTSGRDLLGFIIRRFGRLWPLHATVLGLFVVVAAVKLAAVHFAHVSLQNAPFTGEQSWTSLVANLVLLQSMGLTDLVTWNGPSWSISAEFWAYLVFGLLLQKAPGYVGKLSLLIVGVASSLLVWRSDTLMDTHFRLGLFRGLFGFFTGVLVQILCTRWPRRRLVAATGLEFVVVAVVVAFVSLGYDSAWSFAAPLVFALPVYVFAEGQGRISDTLRHRYLQRLGIWSYSIYLLHAWVIVQFFLVVALLTRLEGRIPFLALVHSVTKNTYARDALSVTLLAVIVALSALSYRFIEAPSRAYFSRLAQRIIRSN